MNNLKKISKLILINTIILILLIVFVNFIAIFTYQGYEKIKKNKEHFDLRAQLPNYQEIKWSDQHFRELSELRAEYQSYIGWRMLEFSGKTISVNIDGIRTTPQHEDVNQNSSLVVFLGGSTTWGVGANDNNTIPALFSKKGKGKFKTINFGDHSYRAYQSFLFFNSKINEGLQPDIVISYDGVNEKVGFSKNHDPISHSRENQIRDLMKGQDSNQNEKEMMSFKRYFFGPLITLVSRIKGNDEPENSESLITEEKSDEVAKALLNSWLNSKRLAEESGALFFCVLQPNAVIGDPNLEHLKINPERIVVYEKLYASIIKLLDTPSYNLLADNFIDLRSVLDGDEKYYIDFCHLSPNGNQVVTNQLYEEIDNRIQALNNSKN